MSTPRSPRSRSLWLLTLLGLTLTHIAGLAQEWPSKAITLVVPFPPGGSNDVAARVVAVTDVIAGQVTLAVLGAAAVLPHIKSGKLIPLAVSTRQRSPMLLGTPTLAESGAGDIDVPQWSALFAVEGTPAAVVGPGLARAAGALEGALSRRGAKADDCLDH